MFDALTLSFTADARLNDLRREASHEWDLRPLREERTSGEARIGVRRTVRAWLSRAGWPVGGRPAAPSHW